MPATATEQHSSGETSYALVSAKLVEPDKLVAFSQVVWPDGPPDRLLASWWRFASEDCSVAAIHRPTGLMAGLCAGRPSEWLIGTQPCAAVAICDWYVAPAHAARMLGRRLVRHFARPDRLLYAFSMSDDAVAYLARLGWTGPYSSTLLALPLPRVARWMQSIVRLAPGLSLHDYEVAAGALPAPLADQLDCMNEARAGIAPAHMRRGADEWRWRLSLCGERSYRVSVACRDGEPVGYSAVRLLAPGSSRGLGRLSGALLADLFSIDANRQVLRALIARATAHAGDLGAAAALAATTNAHYRRELASMGFLSPQFPLLGRLLARRAPRFMWLPRGPAAQLTANDLLLGFADSDVDFKL
jgi:hypothetical protein